MIASQDLPFAASWLLIGPWIVGATFLWAGGIKALAPHVFSAHLGKLAWIPRRLNSSAVVAGAGLESAWGSALLLGVYPGFVLPATMALLAGLTAVRWLGVKSRKTNGCGCYGGYGVPSMAQSIGLNPPPGGLLISGWILAPRAPGTPVWKLA